jgi:hypothetical protein
MRLLYGQDNDMNKTKISISENCSALHSKAVTFLNKIA